MTKKEKLINEYKRQLEVGSKNIKKSEIKLAKFKEQNNLIAIKNFEYSIEIMKKNLVRAESRLKELM